MHRAAAGADQRVARFIVVEVFGAERADRDQPVGAGIGEFYEQARAGDAGNATLEGGADAVGEEVRDQPILGLALGQHGAPFGGGNLGTDFAQHRHGE